VPGVQGRSIDSKETSAAVMRVWACGERNISGLRIVIFALQKQLRDICCRCTPRESVEF
jgi:hypothetical protein